MHICMAYTNTLDNVKFILEDERKDILLLSTYPYSTIACHFFLSLVFQFEGKNKS